MLRGKVEGEKAPLSEGSSVKESPGDKQASALVSGEAHLCGGPIFSVKSGPVSEYSVTVVIKHMLLVEEISQSCAVCLFAKLIMAPKKFQA